MLVPDTAHEQDAQYQAVAMKRKLIYQSILPYPVIGFIL